MIEPDDIVFADFGPIFEEWEADLGRTYVLGGDAGKHRLAQDLPVIWAAGRRLRAHPDHRRAAHAEVARLAADAGGR